MVTRVPMAGCENSKRSNGFAGGGVRQALRQSKAASGSQIRNPKTEARKKAEGPKSEWEGGLIIAP